MKTKAKTTQQQSLFKVAKPKVTPCEKCKGFSLKARAVKSVARDSKGRFKKPR